MQSAEAEGNQIEIMTGMETLAETAKTQFGISLAPQQVRMFESYAADLQEWNARINLTAITAPDEVRVKHFLDSLSCVPAMRSQPSARVVDVGSGAGFPGIPLKIAMPAIQLTLVESVGKKAEYCRGLIDRLGLRGVEVVNARVEDVGRDAKHREQYDFAIARAVAELPILVEYLLPLVKIGGCAIAQKGASGPAEAQTARHALSLLGGVLFRVEPVELPGVAETRFLILITKKACTPEKYPRNPGVPAKKPLK
jgi:16S rRNA (guanine527-N7)-methyltransferase